MDSVPLTTMIRKNGKDYINPNINIIIDENKFTAYALNPEHEVGRHKAYVFNQVLGYNLTN